MNGDKMTRVNAPLLFGRLVQCMLLTCEQLLEQGIDVIYQSDEVICRSGPPI